MSQKKLTSDYIPLWNRDSNGVGVYNVELAASLDEPYQQIQVALNGYIITNMAQHSAALLLADNPTSKMRPHVLETTARKRLYGRKMLAAIPQN